MTLYDFTFVVQADPDTDDFEDRFIEAGCDDVTFLLMRGAVALSFDREAESFKDAVFSAYRQIRSTGAEILRFEPDFLVSATDIAERCGLTRASINLYVQGGRRQDFPAPCARVNSRSPLWDWVEVSRWMVSNDILSEDQFRIALISRIINAGAQLNHAVPGANFDIEAALEVA